MHSKEQQILDAAFRLMNQHGIRKVTMSELAEAAGMSRPSLYASFASKEAVFDAISVRHTARVEAQTKERLPKARTLEAQLALLFEVWIVAPFASVIDSPAGLDLLGNAATYAPEATADIYRRFEEHLVRLLKPELPRKKGGGKGGMSARDLAHILTLATKGLKASTTTLAELRRMIDGLIAMALATARGG